MSTPHSGQRAISLDEASRQLEQAVHDAQVAFDCIGLGNLDRAHTHAITARAAVDAAETILRAALVGDPIGGDPTSGRSPVADPFGGRADAFGGEAFGVDGAFETR
jgi:hypothetical protein